MKKLIPQITIATIIGIALLTSCQKESATSAKDGKAKGPSMVGYILVKSEPITLNQELAGRTSAFKISEIRPQVTGIIKARLFREGTRVNAGQALYQIDQSSYRASYNSASAALQQAQANYDAARQKFARYEELVKMDAVSQQEYEDARTALRVATANVSFLRAQVDNANINLRYTNVLAPITGRISKSNVTAGALVTANQAQSLATIQDISSIYVDFTQSYDELLKLRRDFATGALNTPSSANVTLKLSDGTNFDQIGQIQFSEITVDPATGSVGLRALFPNPNGILLPGMYVHARIEKGVVRNGFIVPQRAVSIDGTGVAHVFIVGEDGKAKSQIVETGDMIGGNWQITSGLKEGDKVIVEGLLRLRPGAQVKAKLANTMQTPAADPKSERK